MHQKIPFQGTKFKKFSREGGRADVQMSVTFMYCLEMVKRILIFFHFLLARPRPSSSCKRHSDMDHGPLNMGIKCRCGYEKIVIFDQYLTLSRKRYKLRP